MTSLKLGPNTIHIKRKRADDPVDSLHLEPSTQKRARTSTVSRVVFKRLAQPLSAPPPPSAPVQSTGIPIVIATKPGDEVRDPLALHVGKTAPLALQTRGEDGDLKFEPAVQGELMDLDEEYVYDVFVRDTSPADQNDVKLNTGILYIPAGSAGEWGTIDFWVGDEEDPAYLSDDQDSNAEDHYTADYPDEEDEEDSEYHGYGDGDSGDDNDYGGARYVVDYEHDEKDYVEKFNPANIVDLSRSR